MSPLHRIEVWTPTGKGGAEEGFFKSTTLSALGHCIQLGHSPGHRCPLPSPSPHGVFTVIDINGIHTLLVDFCGCHKGSKDHGVQIRQYGWYPATVRAPRSAATIRVLALFQLVSFESKTSTQHFYRAIECLTDNTGLGKIKNLYLAFLNMTRQFGHLKMLKRARRGNSESGAGGTAEGELVLLCPACPQPGINLPNGWQTSIFWFLYILFVGIDANFRLRRKMVSNRHKDPSLSSGSSYFVWNEPFVGFLEEKEAQIEQKKSTCSNHDAVNKHRDRKGLAATGIAAVGCIRHDFKRPCSVVDPQKGERYCNVDYAFASSLRNNPIIHMLVSYDIVCQWNINIPDRFANYPEWMHLDETGLGKKEMRFLVPKFHLPAHILACQTKYSFNYHSHVGRTDGEAVERGWSNLNTLAGSTWEMGPGSREDALNNHMGDRNWKKTYGLIALLKRRIKTAVPRAAETRQDIDEFTRALEEHHSVEVKEWDEMLTKWAANPTESVNPFEPTMKAPSFNAVRIQLAQEEARDLINGANAPLSESVSASQLIALGIEIESNQRKLEALRKVASTEGRVAGLQVKSTNLLHKIEGWITVQEVYTPALHAVRTTYWDTWREESASTGKSADIKPEKINLLLPSSNQRNVGYDPRLIWLEWELRHGQAMDALDGAREMSRLDAYVRGDKVKFSQGQRANTRSNNILSRLEQRKETIRLTYNAARDALIALGPKVGVLNPERLYPELKATDIVSLRVDPSLAKLGHNAEAGSEGNREIPWIWRHFSIGTDTNGDSSLHETLRIEWCRGTARAERWREEVMLLVEEHRRVVEFFKHQAQWWDIRAHDEEDWKLAGISCNAAFCEGRRAYAFRQAALYSDLAAQGVEKWADVPQYIAEGGQSPLFVEEEETS